MKIIHHNDADGYMSANIVYNCLSPEQKAEITVEDFICMDYSKPLDLNLIDKDEEIYIVDYSIPPHQMETLLEAYTKNVTWIDHHKSAIEQYKAYPELLKSIDGVRFDGISATGLCYLYFTDDLSNTGNYTKDYYKMMRCLELAPFGIQYINDWDVWNHFIPETKSFMIALQAMPDIWESPMNDFWDSLGENDTTRLNSMIATGVDMTRFRDSWAKQFRNRYGFEINLEGHLIYCLNLGNANSEYFGDLLDKYEAVMTFCFNGELFNASIYSDGNLDVSEIAKKFGGGGHKGASGFTFTDFNFITSRLGGILDD